MGNINYKAIYEKNKHDWYAMTEEPQKYEALLAGHYSDCNHFVYELLQNAEDEHASKAVFEYHSDKLVFYHNGDPFDEADVRGVSSMLMGTKDREDAQTIGRFGMGFKSVFKYTYQPEIYSDDEAFRIKHYLLPEEIIEGWNPDKEKEQIICTLGEGRSFIPFAQDKHLTKIIIPFKKYDKNGKLSAVPGEDVLEKLHSLNGEILLFLSYIKNLYWVNKETGQFAYISLKSDEKDKKLITCRIESSSNDGKEDIARFLKYKKTFDHPDMKNAEVSVAYKLNSRADNVNAVEEAPVWVYFPTRDMTDLPFLIHGSFETAVSREKLMTPSDFNDYLFDKLGDLIAESMDDLASKKLITQMFLRKIVITAFKDESENGTIHGLKDKITEVFKRDGIIPDRNGNYRKPDDLRLPLPFRMGDFKERPFIGNIFKNVEAFVAFNNEQEVNFTEYYLWLTNDLKISIYDMSDMARDIKNLPEGTKILDGSEFYTSLTDFYSFLSDNRTDVYDTGLSYSRSGAYYSSIRGIIEEAWNILRQEPIILNRLNVLVPAQIDGKSNIYLSSSSQYKSVMQKDIVNSSIANTFRKLLEEGFQIEEFDNFQYVKEKVIKKYIDIDENIGFDDDDNFEKEYIEDLNQIFVLLENSDEKNEIRNLLKDAYIVKIKTEKGEEDNIFSKPGKTFIPSSEEGIDLNIYYAEGCNDDEDNPDNWKYYGTFPVDADFYNAHNIPLSKLSKLGLITTLVSDGIRHMEGIGDGYWCAQGEYCPYINIDSIDGNLYFIDKHPELDLAKKKSKEILKLMLSISKKLKGNIKKRKTNPYIIEEKSGLLQSLNDYSWVFNNDMVNGRPCDFSKYDLNTALYGPVLPDKDAYETLGFIEKEEDTAEETLQRAQKLSNRDKERLLKWLAKDLGKEITSPGEDDWGEDESSEYFNPSEITDDEFPIRKVNNIDYLNRHVQEQFFCADPVTYKKVLRQIRVSKNEKTDRSYAIGMYTNSSNVTFCQMCKKPSPFTEAVQIANFGIEMPQLNMCLCTSCAAKYRSIYNAGKEEFTKKISDAIMSLNPYEVSDEYSIELSSDSTIHFTQTHIAEIQEILRLLKEYGVPSEHNNDQATTDITEEIEYEDEPIACEGSAIVYCKPFDGDQIVNNVLQPDKFPLHQKFIGHKAGDTVRFRNHEYKIISIKNR